jgi:CDP-glucose 4,6-dehydratase
MMSDYAGVRVLVTGHTGFKGGWLCACLKQSGAQVSGLSLEPDTSPNLFSVARIAEGMTSYIGDIRDSGRVTEVFERVEPQIVFHLAAQPLVRRSYRMPVETFATNVLGTVHVLDAASRSRNLQAVVCVTTDKVYENLESRHGYRESDRLGGKDPYSASKACAELVAACFAQTLFKDRGGARLATARGGNVVGGGDWSEDRLLPDIVRAIDGGRRLVLRNPQAVRPWQHVIELARGYLLLGARLMRGECEGAWNFGPEKADELSVERLVQLFLQAWGDNSLAIEFQPSALAETGVLTLNSEKAAAGLGWRPLLDAPATIAMTSSWYKRFLEGSDAAALVAEQIAQYCERIADCQPQHL